MLPPPAATRHAGPALWRLAVGPLFVLGLLATMASPAWAHVHVLGAEPEGGAHLDEAPEQAQVWFDQPVEPLRGALEVVGEDGIRVDLGDAGQPEGSPNGVRVSLPDDLPTGEYTTRWRVQGADGHVQKGSWTFHVRTEPHGTEDDAPAEGSQAAGGETKDAVAAADALATGEAQTALPVAMGLTALLAGLLAAGLAALMMWRAGELGRAPQPGHH